MLNFELVFLEYHQPHLQAIVVIKTLQVRVGH